MIGLEFVHIDTGACAHKKPAAALRIVGQYLVCGHCGAELPEFLHHTVVRCDGSVVRVTQADFGELHVCGRDAVGESIETLLDLSAPIA